MGKVFAVLCAIAVVLCLTVGSGYLIHLKLGSEAVSAWGAYLAGCGTLAVSLAAIVTGSLAYRDYRTRLLADKSKWLFQLYEKLFESAQYKGVRRKIDYGETEEIKMLIKLDAENEKFTEAQQGVFDQFTDYLNFFEFLARLKEVGELTSQDISATFDYYLKLLARKRNPEIRQYLEKEGFESLNKLLLQEYEGQDKDRRK